MGKYPSKVFNKRVKEYCLNRGRRPVMGVPFTSAFGKTDLNPVRGLVTGPLEPFGIHKGLKEDDCMVVDLLPVPGKDFSHPAQDVGGKIWDLNPGEDKEACILSNKMDVSIPVSRSPSDEIISRGYLPCPCPPTNADKGTILMKGDILEMLTHCLAVTEVMVSLNETIVERLPFSVSYHLNLDGGESRKGGTDGLRRVEGDLKGPLLPFAPPSIPSRREIEQPFSFKAQEEFPAGHLLETSIGLPPVPEVANLPGDECPALSPASFNDRADGDNITICDPSAPDDKWCIHGPLYSIMF